MPDAITITVPNVDLDELRQQYRDFMAARDALGASDANDRLEGLENLLSAMVNAQQGATHERYVAELEPCARAVIYGTEDGEGRAGVAIDGPIVGAGFYPTTDGTVDVAGLRVRLEVDEDEGLWSLTTRKIDGQIVRAENVTLTFALEGPTLAFEMPRDAGCAYFAETER